MSFLLPSISRPKSLSSSSSSCIQQKAGCLLNHNHQSSSSYNNISLLSSIPITEKQQQQLQTTPPPSSKHQPLPSPDFDEFYVNLGFAVRTLREDMPLLFTKDLNYSIYRDDVTFVDPLNTFTGIENYKLIFWALRFHGRILFREINLEVLRIWQPAENVILIRWNLRGLPRVPWEANGQFQGTSRYKLDRNGKIYEHKVDNLAFNFPQTLTQTTSVLDLVTASPNPMFLWAPVDDVYSNYLSSWVQFYRVVRQTLVNENQLAIHNHLVTCS